VTLGSSPVPFLGLGDYDLGMRLACLLGLCVSLAPPLSANPFADLASPSSETRANAAEIIRDHHLFKPSDRGKWEKFISSLHGRSWEDVQAAVREVKGGQLSWSISGNCNSFRLDDCWIGVCEFEHNVVTSARLLLEPNPVQVGPPPGYSGYWRIYRLNGEALPLELYTRGRVGSPNTATR
jgi:hypothetical protein